MKQKAYVILGTHKKTGEIVGACEKFSDFTIHKNRVSIFSNYNSDTYYGELYAEKLKQDKVLRNNSSSPNQLRWRDLKNWYMKDIQKKYSQYKFRVYRLNSKHCPIKVDWTERYDMRRKHILYRNIVNMIS